MGTTSRRALGAAVFLLALSPILADTVILKNGSSFDGTIVEETEDHVVLSLAGGSLTFPRSDVVRVVRDPETRPPTPPKEGPGPEPTTPADPVQVPPAAPPDGTTGETLRAADLARVPQSPRVTIEAAGRPVSEVLAELTGQIAFRFTPPFSGGGKPIDLREKEAPVWKAVLSICRQGPWGLCVVQDSTYDGLVLRVDDDDPLLVADIQGPVLFVAHGRIKDHVFDDTGAFVEKEGIKFSLWIDPNGRMRIVEPRLEPEFLFTFDDGRQVQLKADKETQFMLNGREWLFFPREELAAASADVRVHVPLFGAVAVGEATLPWRAGAVASSGQAELTIRDVKTDQVEVRDEEDRFKTKTVDRFVVTIHAIHTTGKLMARISEERRQPTPEEQKLLQAPPESMAVEAHEAWIVGEDGRRLRATLDDAPGISSPWHGVTTEATVRVDEPGFVPKEVVFRWAHDFRHFELDFALDDAPLGAR